MDRAFPFELRHGALGSGAGGTVWRALHRTSGAEVAVKILRGVEGQASWRAEAQLIGRLDHPHIVRLLDFGAVSAPLPLPGGELAPAGTGWLATAFVDGGTLVEWLGDPTVEWWDVREVLRELGAALAHAHANAVLHRDLKPANVLLTRSPAVGQGVRLADFGGGLARGGGASRAAGTKGYRSPEVGRVGPPLPEGPWSDLYSLGALGWALVSGAPPPDVGDAEGDPAEWSAALALRPRFPVPAGLEALLRSLLHWHPSRRPAFAADVLRAVERLGPPGGPTFPRAVAPAPRSEPTFQLPGAEPGEGTSPPRPASPPTEEAPPAPPRPATPPTEEAPAAAPPPPPAPPTPAAPTPWEGPPGVPFPLRDLPHDSPLDTQRAADLVAVRSLRLRPAPTVAWAAERGRLAAALARAAEGGAVVHRLRAADPLVSRRLLGWVEAWAVEAGVRVLRLEIGADGQRAPLLDALRDPFQSPPAAGRGRGGDLLLDPAEVAATLRVLAGWRPLLLLVPDVDLAPGLAELLTRAWPLGSRPAARVLVVETAAPGATLPSWGATAATVEEWTVPDGGELDFAATLRSQLRVRGALLGALRAEVGDDVERALTLLEHWLGLGWVRVTTRGLGPGEGPAPPPPWPHAGSGRDRLGAAWAAARGAERAAWLAAAALSPRLDEQDWEGAIHAWQATRGPLPGAEAALGAVRDQLRELALVEPVPGGWRLDPRAAEALAEVSRGDPDLAFAHRCAAAVVRGHPEGPERDRRLARHLLGAGDPSAATAHVVAAARVQARSGSVDAARRLLDDWEAAAEAQRLPLMARERVEVVLARAELLLLQGRRAEVEAVLDPVVERHGQRPDPLLLARLFRFRGMARRAKRESWPAAQDDLFRAVAAAARAAKAGLPGAAEELARATLHRATALRLLQRPGEAEADVREARRLFEQLGDQHGVGDALTEHANQAGKLAQDWVLAERIAVEARARYEAVGWRRGVLVAELSRAGALLEQGRLAEATEVYTFLVDRFEEDGHRGAGACRVNLAVIALREGRPEAAAEQLRLVEASPAGPAVGGWLAAEVELGLAACAAEEPGWTLRLLGGMRALAGHDLDETQEELRAAARARALARGFRPSREDVAAFVGLPWPGPTGG